MKFIPFLLLMVFMAQVGAQNTEPEKEIKVGLVLSGGGAKGMAHIGALKVIEEAGVKIDYIGGTSMGAIVGALYASGYSATQLDSIFRNIDFNSLISDELPRNVKTFYEKEDSERYAINIPFDNFKLAIPQGFSGGQNIYHQMVKYLYHVKDINDFKQLPIPFFCIATNVETGNQVILDKGYLPEAIMASGTFPSFFEPSNIDGDILIDGGVVNNYPLEEVKKMGADVIIGVDVQHALRDRSELSSATGILLQINNYRTVADMIEKASATDVYIKPDMTNYTVMDFDLDDEIIEKGKQAAEEKFDQLKEVASRQSGSFKVPGHIEPVDSLSISKLTLAGDNESFTRGYVKGKLRFSLDEETTFFKLQQGINNLAATGNFKTIRYELLSDGEGDDLILKLNESPNKTFLKIGAHYDDLYHSAAIINLTHKNLIFGDDVASFDLILGDQVRYNMQYYIDKGSYWSFGINSRFDNFGQEVDFDLIESNFPETTGLSINFLDMDVLDITNQIYVQTVLQEKFGFILGIEHKFLEYSSDTIASDSDDGTEIPNSTEDRTYFEKSNFYSTYGQLKFDTYDDTYFPTKGLFFDGDFHFYLLSSDFRGNFKEFSVAKGRMGAAFALAKNLYLNIETEGGFKLGTSGVASFDFILGGYGNNLINNLIPFIGYDYLSIPGNSYVKSYARFDLEFAPKNHLMLTANIANVDDDLFRTGEWFTEPDYSGFGIGYGFETFMGPLQVMYSFSPQGSNRLFFSLGYWF
ncbi:patatin-like phospholipase family protein [Maribacter polysaccharolyticus]|uniref:patatin-like phospholipase family protein n=1 Tax=Maribacter polysaccharolyticus TaxID=3020831 RepID=UPI00237F30DE|nr:patatin-like phospholipase family protein [Maribacter polysaccharolyticus]MDE3743112.1 patatin-like phospholipase family protein [Maribacter polysaccharolyticus]